MWDDFVILPEILNMSITGGIVIAAVLICRLFLRRAPKVFSYALWALVLVRLLCPVSIPSPVSLLNVLCPSAAEMGRMEYIPERIAYMAEPAVTLPIPVGNEAISGSLPKPEPVTSANPMQIVIAVLTNIWLLGMAAMLIISIVKFVRLKKRLVGAVHAGDNVYLSDYITSPFVLGLFRPRIYLPSALADPSRDYILLHERHHIRRGDHVMRMLAFAALCVHWFNPLVWAAFFLSGKDMEMSCDEAVMKQMDGDVRGDYSKCLLGLATGRRLNFGMPLAFGEGDVKSRIKNVLNYKKPAFWVILAATALCGAAAVCLLTNPEPDAKKDEAVAALQEKEDEAIAALQEKFPEYFRLGTFKGLEVYVWQMAENNYSFGAMQGTNRNKTEEELMSLQPATADEMRAILSYYDIPDSSIFVIPYQNPTSSYLYTIDDQRAYIRSVRSMLGLDPDYVVEIRDIMNEWDDTEKEDMGGSAAAEQAAWEEPEVVLLEDGGETVIKQIDSSDVDIEAAQQPRRDDTEWGSHFYWDDISDAAAYDAAMEYYKGTVFEVVSMQVLKQSDAVVKYSVCVSRDGVKQEPDRMITLVLRDGEWVVTGEGY